MLANLYIGEQIDLCPDKFNNLWQNNNNVSNDKYYLTKNRDARRHLASASCYLSLDSSDCKVLAEFMSHSIAVHDLHYTHIRPMVFKASHLSNHHYNKSNIFVSNRPSSTIFFSREQPTSWRIWRVKIWKKLRRFHSKIFESNEFNSHYHYMIELS